MFGLNRHVNASSPLVSPFTKAEVPHIKVLSNEHRKFQKTARFKKVPLSGITLRDSVVVFALCLPRRESTAPAGSADLIAGKYRAWPGGGIGLALKQCAGAAALAGNVGFEFGFIRLSCLHDIPQTLGGGSRGIQHWQR